MAFSIETEIHVRSDPTIVWNVLTDFGSHDRWNPYVSAWELLDGPLASGGRMNIVGLPGGRPMRFRPRIEEVVPFERLRYVHRIGGGALLGADHTIELRRSESGTYVIQREAFGGLLATLAHNAIARDARAGFAAMNWALKQRAEAISRGDAIVGGSLHRSRAVVLHGYGGVDRLGVSEIPTPPPRPHEVLVRVHAAGLNRGDAKRREGEMRFIEPFALPYVLGYDFAGTAVAVGGSVSDVSPGDVVFGMRPITRPGTYATHLNVYGRHLAVLSNEVDRVEAAVTPLAGSTALQALTRQASVRPGSRVFVQGASGGVGSFAVRIAKLLGAHVTATASEASSAMVRGLGADCVVDYRQTRGWDREGPWDVLFDTVGNVPFAEASRHIARDGAMVTIVPSLSTFVTAWTSRWSRGPRLKTFLVKPRRDDLRRLAGWLASGELRPVVENVYGMAEIRAAHERLESGATHGKLALLLEP